ncbi:MAG TPA: hypothetical protein VKY22_29380 [Bradyrhizobium sp.]|nr:hypothetical protein [Bradyrhizobium sp.]
MNLHLQKSPRGNPAWKAGVSGNPAGRPMASRQRLGEKIIANIAALWESEGEAVLRRLIAEDPATFAKLAFQILPKDVLVNVQQSTPGGLEPEQWARLREILAMVERIAPPGTSPDAALMALENGLRAEFAVPIGHAPEALAIEHAPALPPPPY